DVSRDSDVAVSVYARQPGGFDIILGSAKLHPSFVDQQLQDQWFPLMLSGADENTNIQNGEVHLQLAFNKSGKNQSLTIEEFELLKVIGKGSFGKVMQVRKKDTGRIYAMKIIRKSHIVERAEVAHTLAERTVLAQLNHPFIVPLKFSFQTPEKLYLVLAFVNGGELFHHLQREGRFTEDRAKFYTAELFCALECLHSYNIIYRDLKPENILLDYTGHIALCDFGLCKLNMKEGHKTNTFCGTPEYLAPELLLGQGYTKTVDWWTLGILLFEMLTGLPPFYDENTNEMYKKILTEELKCPDELSTQAKDLLKGLLNRDPNNRLGAKGHEEIKRHPFFADINWTKLMARKYQPPFRPNVSSATDTSNFDEEFTSEIPMDSVSADSHLSETVQQQFAGFSYQAQDHIGSVIGANAVGSLIDRTARASIAGSYRPAMRGPHGAR
ncbi:AGC protein kinase Gad8, partial [Quaeritorhiza haematococci]